MVVWSVDVDAMVPQRSSVLVVCLAAALALSGCAGQQLDDTQEQRVAEQFEERLAELDGYHATVTTTATVDDRTVNTTADVWTRTDTGEMRQEVVAPAERAGDRIVSNGSVMWSYDAAANTATRIDVPEMGERNGMVPQVDRLVERYDIYSNGTVDIADTEAHKLTLVPEESTAESLSGTTTVWVDTETMFPVKMRMELGEMTSTIRYENLTLDPAFDEGTFEFDPPAGVTIEEAGISNVSEFDDRAALADATDRSLPDRSLPGGFTFEEGMVTDRNGTTNVALQYQNGSGQLTVSLSNAETGPTTDGETISLGDRDGRYADVGPVGRVSWTCETTSYSAVGQLEKQTLREIAVAIGC